MRSILKSKLFISVILSVAVIAAVAIVKVNVEHSGDNVQTQLDLGKRYVSELDYENAIIAYEDALKLDPYCLDAYLGLSDVYLALGDTDKAIEIMQQAKEMMPESVEIYESLAQIYASQNQMELMVSILEEGIGATNSERLREMLREYQSEGERTELAESNRINGTSEEGISLEDKEEKENTLTNVGLRQEEPLLVISRGEEELIAVPLIVPTPLPEPTGNDSDNSENDSGGSSDYNWENISSGSSENESGGGLGEESGSGSESGSGNESGSGLGNESGNGSGNESGSGLGNESGSGSGNESGGDSGSGSGTTPIPSLPTMGIVGNVYNINGEGIDGVTITIDSARLTTPIVANTDTIGNYIQGLSVGTYSVVLSKAGYVDLRTSISVLRDALTSSSYIMLTEEESRRSASLTGIVISTSDYGAVDDATIALLNGFDRTSNGDQSVIASSPHTTTGSDGRFSLDHVNAGYYTIEASKDDYSVYHHNQTLKPGENELSIDMHPVIRVQGQYRITLTWGSAPNDLDSHLVCRGNDNYHVYYGNKDAGDGITNLDRDDTNAFGPETITVKIGENNSYIYAVRNFSDGGAAAGQEAAWNLANSGAQVEVEGDEGIIFRGNVPFAQGITWEVFRIENERLIVTNKVVFEYPTELPASGSDCDVPAVAPPSPDDVNAGVENTEAEESVPAESGIMETTEFELTVFVEDTEAEVVESIGLEVVEALENRGMEEEEENESTAVEAGESESGAGEMEKNENVTVEAEENESAAVEVEESAEAATGENTKAEETSKSEEHPILEIMAEPSESAAYEEAEKSAEDNEEEKSEEAGGIEEVNG